jgi:molybdopterin converting factor small subunit
LKVLVSFVGNQDPISENTNEEGSIVTLCRKIKPNVVYLLPTAAGLNVKSNTEENAMLTRDWICEDKQSFPNVKVFIKPINLSDPRNYLEILPRTRLVINEIIAELDGIEYELHLNCSSGTPQLKAAWLMLSNAGFLADSHLWEVADPRHCSEENRVTPLEITFLEEENIIQRLKRFSDESFFHGIADECSRLKEISCYSYRKEKAELMERIFRAYQSWDLIIYKEAYQVLNSVRNQICRARDLVLLNEIIEKQVYVLSLLQKEEKQENEYNLIDLYYNARRRFARRDFTDTLSRFWRVYEGTLFAHLRRQYNVEPTELSQSKNKKTAQKIKDYLSETRRDTRSFSIRTAEVVLRDVLKDSRFGAVENKELSVKRGESFQKMLLKDIMEELRNRRNHSIVAHGMQPINDDDAQNCLLAMEIILKEFFDCDLIEDYPLSSSNLLKVLSVLEDSYKVC